MRFAVQPRNIRNIRVVDNILRVDALPEKLSETPCRCFPLVDLFASGIFLPGPKAPFLLVFCT
jgi:hypothetical protein